jgi:hypothetical protein
LEQSRPPHERGLPEGLRAAIESTLSSLGEAGSSAAADLQAGTLGRAGELLDEIATRGEGTRAEIARRADAARAELERRGQEAVEASTAIATRVLEAVSETLRGDSDRDSKSELEGE